MAYQGYGGQGGQQGYGNYNPYSEATQNPYSQTGAQAPPGAVYNSHRQGVQEQGSSYYAGDEEQGNGRYEMTNMNGDRSNPDRILNECRGVDHAIDDLEMQLGRLKDLQRRALDDTDAASSSPLRQEIDRIGQDIMTRYQGLVQRVKAIKQDRESGSQRNKAQVGKVDRRLKSAINQFQQQDRDHRKALQEQMARQYRIVRPEASDAEVREAVEDPSNTQVFSQALIQTDRRGQAQSVARNVRTRHEEIQKIERQMMELAQLFQDLEALVIQQEPAVQQIEAKGEEVQDHVQKANVELDGAVKKARAARRKKWYCVGIVVLIIIVILIVVFAVLGAMGKFSHNNRPGPQ